MHLKYKTVQIYLSPLLICALSILITGCTNPFNTRSIETPDAGASIDIYEDPGRPENVLLNLPRSIEQANIERYLRNFSSFDGTNGKRYKFIGDAGLNQQLVQGWGYADERNYFEHIIFPADKAAPQLRFSYLDSIPALQAINVNAFDDSVQTDFFRYELSVQYRDSIQIYRGRSQFRLYRNRNSAGEEWLIYLWTDQADPNKNWPSWTALKVANR